MENRLATIYFDLTDVIDFATRYSRVTGIQRVQLNIVSQLARKHAGTVRCTYFDDRQQAMLEFDPAQLSTNEEFDAEALLADLGVTTRLAWLGGLSKSQIKSYLRRYNNRKWLRAVKKVEIYLSAMLMPGRLAAMGLSRANSRNGAGVAVALRTVAVLESGSVFVCMGSIWKYPEVLAFAKRHSARGEAVVQMVYDLIPIVHPEHYAPAEPREYAEWLTDAFGYVQGFMCISQWTESDLRKYAMRFDRTIATRVVPLAHEFYGFERSAKIDTPSEYADLEGKRFVLCVGTIETRKNGVNLLKAWRALADDLGEQMPTLIFAGKYGKGGEQVQRMLERDDRLAGLVRMEHAPSDRQLAWLYSHCMFTVFPSTYEGWGLPVGEAAWFGKFCVASQATSVPEVCGELMTYIDPAEVESLKSGVKEVVSDADLLRAREIRIEKAPLRRWAHVADDIYQYVTSEVVSAGGSV